MAYPNDIVGNGFPYGFICTQHDYNPHWDIVWSFTYSVSGTEHGFTTYLTPSSTSINGTPGQFLGYYNYGKQAGVLVIAFDTTGLFALPLSGFPGTYNIKKDSIIIRNQNNDIILYEKLSSLNSKFITNFDGVGQTQTLRFRLSRAGTHLSIDFKNNSTSTSYENLTSVSIDISPDIYPILYPAFTVCSPISSTTTPSIFALTNFHIQGETSSPTYENVSYIPLSSVLKTGYTTIDAVTARPPLNI